MKPSFLIKRFAVFYAGAFCVLFVVGLWQGRPWQRAASESALWGGISATVFVGAAIVRARRGQYCALCGESPSGAEAPRGKSHGR